MESAEILNGTTPVKIAIVGTGVSGLTAAWLLHPHHEIVAYESNDYIGGHVHTVLAKQEDLSYPVDTGFIVYNNRTYPLFRSLLNRLNVSTQPTQMSFSVRCERSGLEYCGSSLNGLFAQRRNLFRISFFRMLLDIFRFNRDATRWLDSGLPGGTLAEFLAERRYGEQMVAKYLIPMGAAIWSTDLDRFGQYPARSFLMFFRNHGLLSLKDRPQWRVVAGGSAEYAQALAAPFRSRVRLGCPVRAVRRLVDRVQVVCDAGTETFDHVIIAAHSDQALAMLADPSVSEREILGSIQYQQNVATLHTDTSHLPCRRRAWASWNSRIADGESARVRLTYNMNVLQSLDAPKPFCVSLNSEESIAPREKMDTFVYHHPSYTSGSLRAQQRWQEISGAGRTHYCGAYWGWGFHEDGVRSAVSAVRRLDPAVLREKAFPD